MSRDHAAPLLVVGLVFVAARLAAHGAGVAFDDQTVLRFWHTLDRPLLEARLWESVMHLHSQPPLLNLLLGLVYQLAGEHSGQVFRAGFVLLSAAWAAAVYALGLALGWPRWAACAVASVTAASPAVLLYESFLFYTHPAAALITATGLALAWALRRQDGRGWGLFFGLVAALVGLRSLFHGAWAAAALLGALWVARDRRAVLAGAAIPLLLVGALYAKNAAVLGTASTSSWLGMSLGRMSTDRMPPERCAALVSAGVLDPIAEIRPYSELSAYAALVDTSRKTGVPALDDPHKAGGAINFNHHAYIEISERYAANFVPLLRAHPELYAQKVERAWGRFWKPGWWYPPLEANRAALAPVLSRLRAVAGGAVPKGVVLLALLNALAAAPRAARRPDDAVRAWLGGLVVYVALLGLLLEVGENYRFRFLVMTPALLLACDALLRAAAAAQRGRRA